MASIPKHKKAGHLMNLSLNDSLRYLRTKFGDFIREESAYILTLMLIQNKFLVLLFSHWQSRGFPPPTCSIFFKKWVEMTLIYQIIMKGKKQNLRLKFDRITFLSRCRTPEASSMVYALYSTSLSTFMWTTHFKGLS